VATLADRIADQARLAAICHEEIAPVARVPLRLARAGDGRRAGIARRAGDTGATRFTRLGRIVAAGAIGVAHQARGTAPLAEPGARVTRLAGGVTATADVRGAGEARGARDADAARLPRLGRAVATLADDVAHQARLAGRDDAAAIARVALLPAGAPEGIGAVVVAVVAGVQGATALPRGLCLPGPQGDGHETDGEQPDGEG